jgi:hypothetical protein
MTRVWPVKLRNAVDQTRAVVSRWPATALNGVSPDWAGPSVALATSVDAKANDRPDDGGQSHLRSFREHAKHIGLPSSHYGGTVSSPPALWSSSATSRRSKA